MKNLKTYEELLNENNDNEKDYTSDIIKIIKKKKNNIKYSGERCSGKKCECDFTLSIVNELDDYALTIEASGTVYYIRDENPISITNTNVILDVNIIITDDMGADVILKINQNKIKDAVKDLCL